MMGVDGMNSADIFDEYFDEKKPKYIVRNCPAYQTFYSDTTNGSSSTLCTKGFTKLYCQDCTDCVMKQIVENLRQVAYACHCDSCDGSGYYNGCSDSECGTYQALKSLELLDIQECE